MHRFKVQIRNASTALRWTHHANFDDHLDAVDAAVARRTIHQDDARVISLDHREVIAVFCCAGRTAGLGKLQNLREPMTPTDTAQLLFDAPDGPERIANALLHAAKPAGGSR